MSTTNLGNVIKLTQEQYDDLLAGNLPPHVYDENSIYLVDDDNQYAYTTEHNHFTKAQTITNPADSGNQDVCLDLVSNYAGASNSAMTRYTYGSNCMGCIGVKYYSITGYNATFWHPSKGYLPIMTQEDFSVRKGLYNGNPSVGSTISFPIGSDRTTTLRQYAWLLIGIHNNNTGYSYTLIPTSFLGWLTTTNESFRVDGFHNTSAKYIQIRCDRTNYNNSDDLYIIAKSNVDWLTIDGVCLKADYGNI